MATNNTPGAATFALEIGGAAAAGIRSVTLPVLTFSDAGSPGMSGFEARFNVSGASALLDWVLSIARAKPVNPAGAVIFADQNFNIQRRVDWTAGELTEFAFPTLDARDKTPFSVQFKWEAQSIKYTGGGGGKLLSSPSPKAKNLLNSNFRVRGLPVAAAQVQVIQLPALRMQATLELSHLRITVAGAGVAAARDWAVKFHAGPGVTAADRFKISIDMLDLAQTQTLATIDLDGCALVAFEEPSFDQNSAVMRTATLTFAVQSVDMVAVP